MDEFELLSAIETLFVTTFSYIIYDFDWLIYLLSGLGLVGIISAAVSYLVKGKY